MNGKLQQKTISKAFPIDRTAFEIIILSLLGAFAIVLRAKLRIPLQMPGHHGLEVMAILLIGRNMSKIPIASSISTFVAALFILFPFIGFKDPFLPIIYILMGVTIDFTYKYFKQYRANIIFFALLGGIAYMVIPLSRILIHFTTGYPYQSLIKGGYIYPVISHFIFGVAGAVLAAGVIYSTKKILKH
ncbi:MAG: hypothetical protein K8R58_04855 [Bacteroidales bacterium]|nr:hypothetical protein [Bacteroidales bacterium]